MRTMNWRRVKWLKNISQRNTVISGWVHRRRTTVRIISWNRDREVSSSD